MWDATLPETQPYSTLLLAVRDMRRANDRDQDTGEGDGNDYWGGLLIGFAVLDVLTRRLDDPDRESRGVGQRWRRLYGPVLDADYNFVWRLRNSVVHSYFTPGQGYALDDARDGPPIRGRRLSVPLFCKVTIEDLVERFAYGTDLRQLHVWSE